MPFWRQRLISSVTHPKLRTCFLQTSSLSSLSSSNVAHVCIVGSGPAAFYTAQILLKSRGNIKVDIYERLPVPFGLVRYGVAPDHPEVKNVINTFTQVAKDSRFSYAGNVTVGTDVSLAQLQATYHAVILAYGAAKDKKLKIPGEHLSNVFSAKDFVGWYNGLPECQTLEPRLDCDAAVVIGHGNVALDVSRILLSPPEILAKTDIPQRVLERLVPPLSRLRRVHMVGRRGPLQVAFTIKEFREMLKLPGVSTWLHAGMAGKDGLDAEEDNSRWPELLLPPVEGIPRPRRRLTELLVKTWRNQPTVSSWKVSGSSFSTTKEFHLHFLRSPVQFVHPSGNPTTLSGVEFSRMALQGEPSENQIARSLESAPNEILSAGLAVYSIGYSAVRIDPFLPFDHRRGIIPNVGGRVVENAVEVDAKEAPRIVPGLYCVGWIKRGPVGVILTTIPDAKETADGVLEDLATSNIAAEPKAGLDGVKEILHSKGVRVVSFEDWMRIDQTEQQLGGPAGKPREKLLSPSDMLKVAFQDVAESRCSTSSTSPKQPVQSHDVTHKKP